MRHTGVLLIGALGYVAAAVRLGLLAFSHGLAPRRGLVSDLPEFAPLDLVDPDDLVVGGWDIREGSPLASVRAFATATPSLPGHLVDYLEDDLQRQADDLFFGTLENCGPAIAALGGRAPNAPLTDVVAGLREDIAVFRQRHDLQQVVVVNLASTEPPLPPLPAHLTIEGVQGLLRDDRRCQLRAGTLYAWAAVLEGAAYINFTPANSPLLPAVVQLAEQYAVPVMGDDGKTGETLVKSALAPMFRCRNLQVMSWSGFNLLGNPDGEVLSREENRQSKIRTKGDLLANILGYSPDSRVGIDCVPSLADQKVAWDFIHFQGFLDARMSLQFVWQGYDSLLAAPLVIDLVRFAERAARAGQGGVMHHLASFFKAPLGVTEHGLSEQFALLTTYARQTSTTSAPLTLTGGSG